MRHKSLWTLKNYVASLGHFQIKALLPFCKIVQRNAVDAFQEVDLLRHGGVLSKILSLTLDHTEKKASK